MIEQKELSLSIEGYKSTTMKKDKWEIIQNYGHWQDWERLRISSVCMYCKPINPQGKQSQWRSEVFLTGTSQRRFGPKRRSLEKSKADALRLGKELLLDYEESVRLELIALGVEK